jgi:hypothetical protein
VEGCLGGSRAHMACERGNSTAGLQRAPREEELGGRERGGTTAGLLKSHSLGRSGDGAKHRPVENPTKAELAGGKRDSDVSSVGSGWATGEVGREGLGAVAIRIGGCFPRRSTVPCGVYLQATEFRTSRQERPRSEGENGDLALRSARCATSRPFGPWAANWWRVNGGERETERGLTEKAVEGM